MARSEPDDPGQRNRGERRQRRPVLLGWLTASLVRTLVTLVGVVILVFALGRAVGVDLLGPIAGFLTTETGIWLVVALFGLMLVVVAQRSYVRFYR